MFVKRELKMKQEVFSNNQVLFNKTKYSNIKKVGHDAP